MHLLRICLRLALALVTVMSSAGAPALAQPGSAPPLMLAQSYHPGVSLEDYWVSEKYDGIRAYWDGQSFWTRGGEVIRAPAWFTAGWPAVALDGELWAGRGNFTEAVSTARRQTPEDAAWRRLRFMVFDMPAHPGTFSQRLPALKAALRRLNAPWVQPVPQFKVASHRALQDLLEKTVAAGGEGLMLHRGSSLYRAERSDDLLKLKTHDDAEARVVGHLPGKGRHQGRLGALLVETPEGVRFRLGTGFSDAQRERPPPLGSWVTYRYRGLHASGLPRFASFLRLRPDVSLTKSAGKPASKSP